MQQRCKNRTIFIILLFNFRFLLSAPTHLTMLCDVRLGLVTVDAPVFPLA
jgi:hypothetical protein